MYKHNNSTVNNKRIGATKWENTWLMKNHENVKKKRKVSNS